MYINDLTDNILSEMRLFADNSSLFACVEEVNHTHKKLVQDLGTITSCGCTNGKWFLTLILPSRQ